MTRVTIKDRILTELQRNPQATARELADALGVSRQRIYQALSRYGITPQRPRSPAVKKPPSPPMPTLGGACAPLSHTTCGTISELVAAADLLARGYHVYIPLVRHRGHDLIAVSRAGKILTVEVRGGRKGASGQRVYNAIAQRHMKSDLLAIVIAGEPVEYKPPFEPES